MRIEQRQLGVKIGLDLGERDLALRLNLKMDRLVLRFLRQKLRLMRRQNLIDLRSRLHRQQTTVRVAEGIRS
jgi:hypothetical protein